MYIYELDSITDTNLNVAKDKKRFLGRTWRYERIIYNVAAKIIHLECHRNFYSDIRYDVFRGKFLFADIPLLEEKKNDIFTSTQNTIIFAGSLYKNYRDPSYFIFLFEKACVDIDVNLKFFSNGSCEEYLQECAKNNPKIKRCGYIANSDLQVEMNRCSFFLDIGLTNNNGISPISSKIFSYFSFGKPIIHIRENGNDSALPYFEKYELSLIIDPSDDFDYNVKKLKDFIVQNKDKTVDFNRVRNLFDSNTPEYTANLLIDLAKNI